MADTHLADEYEETVFRGIGYLIDQHGGSTGYRWLDMVDESALDLRHHQRCVLGQVTGAFTATVAEIPDGLEWARFHGFLLSEADVRVHGLSYRGMEDEWRRQIGQLRRQAAEGLHHR